MLHLHETQLHYLWWDVNSTHIAVVPIYASFAHTHHMYVIRLFRPYTCHTPLSPIHTIPYVFHTPLSYIY
jgi:hypothetical protein